MTSLNPVLTIGRQLRETLRLHEGLERRAAEGRAVEMLNLVGIPEARRRLREYPHQLSGGMRQRVMIAMALACNPKLLIADEPTTALDVTIQAQILDLMRDLKRRIGAAIVLITHDLGVIAEVADDVIVMYAGQVVERCAVPRLDRGRSAKLATIEGARVGVQRPRKHLLGPAARAAPSRWCSRTPSPRSRRG